MGALPSWGRSHWLPWGQARLSCVVTLWGLSNSSFLLLPTVGFPNPHPFPYPASYQHQLLHHPEMLKCLPVW